MAVNRFYFITLIALVLLLGFLSYQILKPFLYPIAWAIVLSIVFYPLHAFIYRYIKLKSLVALFITSIILLIILGPFSYLFYVLASELNTLAVYFESEKLDAIKGLLVHPSIKSIVDKILSLLNMTEEQLNKAIADNMARLGKEVISRITSGMADIITISLNFLFMTLSLFFFLRDGPEFLKKAREYMPFSEEQKDRLRKQSQDIIVSTIYGGVAVAIAQGTIAGVSFYFLGISTPVFWGLTTFIASFIPLLGASIIWVPATIYLFLKGTILKGIILALVGIFGISLIDNILRPLIIGGKTKMPILAIFFSILGGIKLFGLIGIIFGPLVLALFVSFIEIFRSIEGGQSI